VFLREILGVPLWFITFDKASMPRGTTVLNPQTGSDSVSFFLLID